MRRVLAEVVAPFTHEGKLHVPLLLLFLLINSLVLVNAVLHDPNEGYDAGDHIQYIKTLAEDRRIPTCADSAQCYIPPLPYMFPALLMASGHAYLFEAARLAQFANILISIALTYYLLKICMLLDPHGVVLRISSLAMFGILPVFYKTFSLIRGEVYLPLLVVFIVYLLLCIFVGGRPTAGNIVLLGLAMGLAVLARQWGFLILPAIFVLLAYLVFTHRTKVMTAVLAGLVCVLGPILMAGWYYGIMFQRYGTLTAWDRPASGLSLSVFPPEFYFGLGSGKLFTDPIRPSFANQFPAIFYSDTWGDYSGYFLVYLRNKVTGEYQSGKDLQRIIQSGKPMPVDLETNRFTINAYLGRVNLISLFPTLIFAAGLVYGIILFVRSLTHHPPTPVTTASLLFILIIASSMAGYGWYLLRYQNHGQGGDLIKATHMLQIFPFLGLLAGQALQGVSERSRRVWLGTMVVLAIIFLHNLPAMVTHYPLSP